MKKIPLYSLLVAAGLTGIQPLAAQPQTAAANTSAATLSPEAQIAAAQANYDAWDQPSQPVGPNHRTTVRTAKTGSRQIVEIGTGMNYWNGVQWVPSNPTFVPVGNGFVAGQLQDPVQLAGDLYATNAVTVRTPEGIILGSSPVAVALYDAASGNFAVIATITNCAATLVESNQVIYPDAFSGNVCASVVYTISQGTFHQDVVFTGPLDPADYGFPRDTTLIQIITEFYGAPVPDELDRPLYVEANAKVRARMASPDLIDQQLGFGRFVLTTGKAYVTPSANNPNGLETLVAKEYKTVGDGTYLFESIPYTSIAVALSNLPPCHPSFGGVKFKSTKGYAGIPRPGGKPHAGPTMAQASHAPVHGVVVDYVANIGGTMSGVTVFQGDTTYLVSSAVSCNGPTTIEGGAVFKYKPGTSITLNSTLTCKTGQYRPAIFTSVDDDTMGDTMNGVPNSGYTGTISSSGYANPALYTQNAMNFTGLRIRYAQEAIRVFGSSTWSVSHAQFVNCIKGLEIQGSGGCGCGCSVGYFNVNNCLFSRVTQPILGTSVGGNVSQYVSLFNATVDQASALGTPSSSCGVSLYIQSTNSIYASVSSNGSVTASGNVNAFYSDGNTFGSSQISVSSFPFLSFGAGNHYLTNVSGIQTSGITNGLPLSLRSDLAKRTTYPPWVIAGTILTTNLTLVPQACRDTNVASLGYHYDPIDYAFGNVYVSNASVTASGGAALATFGTNNSAYGLGFGSGSSFSSIGTPNFPNWIVLFNTVQEGTNLNWQRLANSVTGPLDGNTPAPSIYTRFTSWSVLGQDAAQFNAPANSAQIAFQDSEFHGGKLASSRPTIDLTNCLLERVYASLATSDGNSPYIRNNLFFGGTFNFAPNVSTALVKDNLFDQTAIPNNSSIYTTYNGGYNAFVTGNNRLLPTFGSDIVLSSSPAYQTGTLNSYYQAANSGLVNNGGVTADQLGLYHYTTQTNQVKETNSVVDIGYHYVAADAYGNPIDTDGDGLPDYIEDANGNGVVDSGETSFLNWDTDGDGLSDSEELKILIDANNPSLGHLNPLLADTGNTGIPDGQKDSDHDGISNLGELRIYHSDPANAHTFNSVMNDARYLFTTKASGESSGTTKATLGIANLGNDLLGFQVTGADALAIYDLYYVNNLLDQRWQWRCVYTGLQCDSTGTGDCVLHEPDSSEGFFIALLASDSDYDGLTDGYEAWFTYANGITSMDVRDSDGDGMLDNWEVEYGLDPTVATGNDGPDADPDNDGWANIDEFSYSSNGNDADFDPLYAYTSSANRPVVYVLADDNSYSCSFTIYRNVSYYSSYDNPLTVYYSVGGSLSYDAGDYSLNPAPPEWPRIYSATIPAGHQSVSVIVNATKAGTVNVSLTPYAVSPNPQVSNPYSWAYVLDWNYNRATITCDPCSDPNIISPYAFWSVTDLDQNQYLGNLGAPFGDDSNVPIPVWTEWDGAPNAQWFIEKTINISGYHPDAIWYSIAIDNDYYLWVNNVFVEHVHSDGHARFSDPPKRLPNLIPGNNTVSLIISNITDVDYFSMRVGGGCMKNTAPTAYPQTVTVVKNTPQQINLVGTDPEGDFLTYAITLNPTHGTITGTTPNLLYTPNDPNYTGPDTFTFTVNDGTLTSPPATVSINIVDHR